MSPGASARGGGRGAGRVALVSAALVVAVGWMGPEVAEAQCAMCRSVLASEEGQRLVAAYRDGIALLVLAPFLVVAAVGTLIVRTIRATGPHGAEDAPPAGRAPSHASVTAVARSVAR